MEQCLRLVLCAVLLAPLGVMAQEEPPAEEPAVEPVTEPATEAPADSSEAPAEAPAEVTEESADSGDSAPVSGSFVDALYTPSSTLIAKVPGALSDHEYGTGYDVRALYRWKRWLAFSGEYGQDSFDDINIDLKQTRLGVGLTTDNSSNDMIGLFAEYDKIESDLDSLDGYSGHLRLSREPLSWFRFYIDLGYLMLDGDTEKANGFEFNAGGIFMIDQFGIVVDFRRSTLDGQDSGESFSVADARAGVRYSF